jgi:hypothetical protein
MFLKIGLQGTIGLFSGRESGRRVVEAHQQDEEGFAQEQRTAVSQA